MSVADRDAWLKENGIDPAKMRATALAMRAKLVRGEMPAQLAEAVRKEVQPRVRPTKGSGRAKGQ